MELSFRTAQLPDVETLLGLVSELYVHEGITVSSVVAQAALFGLIEDGALGQVWLVSAGPELVGYAVLTYGYSLEFGGRYGLVDELYVRPGWRGQGVGQATLEFVASQGRAVGLSALRLEVERGNRRAIGLYQRQGFGAHDRDLMTRRL